MSECLIEKMIAQHHIRINICCKCPDNTWSAILYTISLLPQTNKLSSTTDTILSLDLSYLLLRTSNLFTRKSLLLWPLPSVSALSTFNFQQKYHTSTAIIILLSTKLNQGMLSRGIVVVVEFSIKFKYCLGTIANSTSIF